MTFSSFPLQKSLPGVEFRLEKTLILESSLDETLKELAHETAKVEALAKEMKAFAQAVRALNESRPENELDELKAASIVENGFLSLEKLLKGESTTTLKRKTPAETAPIPKRVLAPIDNHPPLAAAVQKPSIRNATVKKIIKACSQHFTKDEQTFCDPAAPFDYPRQVALYLCRNRTQLKQDALAAIFSRSPSRIGHYLNAFTITTQVEKDLAAIETKIAST